MFDVIRNDYSISANIIEKEKKSIENKMWRKGVMKSRKPKRTRWKTGICNKCNQWFECITFAHAELHGYKHPDDMAKKADFITWLE